MNEKNKGKEVIANATSGNNTNINNNSNNKDHKDMRKKLMRVMLIVVGVLVLFLVVLLLIAIIGGGKMDYEDIEQEMKEAAIEYYKVQEGLLPEEEGETVTVRARTLANAELMKPLDELREGENCSGRVEVRKINDNYVYTPYLECGDNYVTKELYKAVLEQGIVTSGSGLYDMNGEKVYRGEDVNNYVKLDNGVFRIVKVTADNKLLLIKSDTDSNFSNSYDDRYNPAKSFNSGFNDYRVSRIYEFLQDLYNGKSDTIILSENDKEKLVNFNLCIGKRSPTDTDKTNALECSDILENQMIGLLTASDYMNASLDATCNATTDRTCQNYNYLKLSGVDWWLITGNSLNNSEVFSVRSGGYIDEYNASSTKKVRPTIMINNNIMIRSGNGSESNPFILK